MIKKHTTNSKNYDGSRRWLHNWLSMVVYVYFKNNYNMTETDSSKKQALDADPKAKQKKPN